MCLKYRSEGLGVMSLGNVQFEKVGLVDAEEFPTGPCPFIRVVQSASAQRLQVGGNLSFETQGRPALATEMRADIPSRVGDKAI